MARKKILAIDCNNPGYITQRLTKAALNFPFLDGKSVPKALKTQICKTL